MKLKRLLSFGFTVLLLISYFIVTDPNSPFLSDLPYGASVILVLGIFVVAMAGIMVIEFLPDFFIDNIYGKEDEMRKKASDTSEGAGYVLMAKSIRILAYAIILGCSIIAYNIS